MNIADRTTSSTLPGQDYFYELTVPIYAFMDQLLTPRQQHWRQGEE
jgi:hypothetical protein